jgi:hypothetical protein
LLPDPTENTVNDVLARYLAESGIPIWREPSARVIGKGQPDFVIRSDSTVYGEGEWSRSYADGMLQAINYGEIPDAGGCFLIAYPEELRGRIAKGWFDANPDLQKILGGVTYRGFYKLRGERAIPWRGKLEEIPDWLRKGVSRHPPPPDEAEFVSIMRDLVNGLTNQLPVEGSYPTLFEHIVASMPKDRGDLETAKRAAAYLLLNQVVFYRILQQPGKFPILRAEAIESPGDLKRNYFDQVLKVDYQAIFALDVATLLPRKATDQIRGMVRIINELQPEQFTRDLLGNIFHSLIPLDVRKPVAAYYTNPVAARLLGRLAIENSADTVADFACGSGTLLMAAYDRKAELLGHPLSAAEHQRFLEHDITGTDIMPFAAHLAVVQLALRNPAFLTDKVRVAVYDSTVLKPGAKIRPIETVLPGGQTYLDQFENGTREGERVRKGAVSGSGTGAGFSLHKVDVAIMNPPFTRKQHVTSEHRALLTERFKDYGKYTSGEQNFFGYFIALGDRFLKDGGRLAMVLPATVLRQLSSRGVRTLLGDRYEVEYIIQSGLRLAFSESTDFREILLVAKKGVPLEERGQCLMATLSARPDLASLDALTKTLKKLRSTPDSPELNADSLRLGIRVNRVPQSSLRGGGPWKQFLPGETLEGWSLPLNPLLVPFEKLTTEVVQGIRFNEVEDFVRPRNTLLSRPREANVRTNWAVIEETDEFIVAKSKRTGATVRVPRAVVRPTTRSVAGMSTIEFTTPFDYIVVGRFPGDTAFWDDPDPDAVLAKRLPHLATREATLLLGGRNNVGLDGTGTHFLAFVSARPVPPTWSFWSVRGLDLDDARLVALWWNSSFNLVQLIENRAEVQGAYMSWLKADILRLRVPDIRALSAASRTSLLKTYAKLARTPFPHLLAQLRGSYEGRIELDSSLARELQLPYTTEKLRELYAALASWITPAEGEHLSPRKGASIADN